MTKPLCLQGGNGGGGGSRTRVRRYRLARIYMCVRPLNLTFGVKKRQKSLNASPDESHHLVSVPHVIASPLNGVYSQPVGDVKIDALLN